MQRLSEFKLKQFKIMQSDKGMKVSLDALIFASYIEKDKKKALDIGAGTGLISLVLAQDSNTKIRAIEVDGFMASICELNFKDSPFSDRLEIRQECFLDYVKVKNSECFDLVVSNPPFFKDSMRSKEEKRSLARHEKYFSYKDILKHAKALMTADASLYLLMPYSRYKEVKEFAENSNLKICELVSIKSRVNKPAKTAIYRFSKEARELVEKEIVVYKENTSDYSDQISQLLRAYLLKL